MSDTPARLEARPAPAPAKAGAPARVVVAFFLAGFATFSLLYCVQPLLPVFARDFRVGPAESSLALSLATSALAVSILCAAAVSEAFGRRGLMFVSMATAAVLNAAAAWVPGWTALLACRAAEGLVLGGVPAVAMAYLAEEIEPKALGAAMGVYVGGTALGGMSGRLVTGMLTDLWGWRAALGGIGAAGLLAALGFLALLPPSRNFTPRRGLGAGYHVRAWLGHLGAPAMRLLYAVGFLAMGAFVAVYNYAGFRLTRPPFALSQTELGFIFTAYLFGVAASWAAGRLGGRFGRASVMAAALITAAAGAAVTLAPSLPAVIAGIVLVTIGFFGAHSTASAWVGRLGVQHKGHAASLYLLAYYAGSSLVGSVGGWFWSAAGWPGVVGFVLSLLGLATLAAVKLARIAPSARG
jgi:MFS transporter, YNFM family, putative membrane transport protein